MGAEVNYLAVFLAGLSSMLVGSIWYAKPVFGSTWQGLVKLKEAQMKARMAPSMLTAIVASLVTAFVLAHVSYLANSFFPENSFLMNSLTTAFWLWLGISATTIVVHDAFEQRRKKLTLINIGNQFATLLVMGFIIGLIGV